MFIQDLSLNNLQGLIYRKTQLTTKNFICGNFFFIYQIVALLNKGSLFGENIFSLQI